MHSQGIYSIYDRKAQYYLPVFVARTDADALRQFADLVVNSDTPLSKYPADFDLVRLGVMNVESGNIDPERPVGLLINGLVSLQASIAERERYRKATTQMDIEDVLRDTPPAQS